MRKGTILSVLFLLSISIPFAYSEEQPQKSITSEDPSIAVQDLELLLKPMRADQLAIEAEAWFKLLEEKVRQISLKEIEIRNVNSEISETKDDAKEKITEIKKAEKAENAEKSSDANTTDTAAKPVDTAAVENELKESVEELKEKTNEIDEKTKEVVEAVEEKTANGDNKEVRSSEKGVVESAAKVEEAKDKLQETAQQVEQADIKIEEKVKKISDAKVELHSKVKEHLLATLNKLREEQIALIERCNKVVTALKSKGGKVEEYEKYISAISGIKVDVKDVSATKSIIQGWLTSPEGGIKWGRKLASFIAILIAFKIASFLLGKTTHHAMRFNRKSSDLLKDFFSKTVAKATMVIGFVVALSMLGINIGPLVAGIGAIGFIIGFALQGTLNNFAAGIMILMHRPYDVGDVINTAGTKGIVDSMNLNTTTIKTFDNQIVVVPNGSIWGGVITNVTGSDTRRVDLVFGISYADDITKARKILVDIVNAHELVLKDPEPNIRVHELADSSVNFICRPWTKTADYWKVYWDITEEVKKRFDDLDITIPFPQRDIHVFHDTTSPIYLEPSSPERHKSIKDFSPHKTDADDPAYENN